MLEFWTKIGLSFEISLLEFFEKSPNDNPDLTAIFIYISEIKFRLRCCSLLILFQAKSVTNSNTPLGIRNKISPAMQYTAYSFSSKISIYRVRKEQITGTIANRKR